MPTEAQPGPRVALFITCLANVLRPQIGFAAAQLLEAAGCRVEVPASQTCCGQPADSSGEDDTARALARQNIALLDGYDYVVAPSGSCINTLRSYPRMLQGDAAWHPRAQRFAERCHELLSFLSDKRGYAPAVALQARGTYHDSCKGLRDLGIKQQPRRLLAGVEGLALAEMEDAEVCCGFGGSFCTKYPAVSGHMVDRKLAHAEATGAELLLGGDLGCLINMAGRARRQGSRLRVYHAAEILAGLGDQPAIGEDAA